MSIYNHSFLEFINPPKLYKTIYGNYQIRGRIKNNNTLKYTYIELKFACYDKKGNVVDTIIDNTENLNSGQIWEFNATYLGLKSILKIELEEVLAYY